MANKRIRNIYLHLTKSCNLRCSYCYFNAGVPMDCELTAEEIGYLFQDIAVLKPEKVVFTGGEPLLRKDIFSIAADFSRIASMGGIKACLMTNGTLIDESNVNLIAAAFDEVRISLDGPEDINDMLRGSGVFEGAGKAVRLLRMAGISPGISITATSQNISRLEEFLEYILDDLYTSNIHISPFRPVGRGAEQTKLICSWREVQLTIAGFWEKRFGRLENLKEAGSYTLMGCGNCGIGCHVNILPDGSVYPCHVLSVPEFLLGNLRKSSLLEILEHSEILKKLRGLDLGKIELDLKLKKLVSNSVCLGEVYRDAPDEMRELLL